MPRGMSVSLSRGIARQCLQSVLESLLPAACFIPWCGAALLCRVLLLRLIEVVVALHDFGACCGGVAPALDLNALALEILIDRKEVSNLPQHVRVDFRVIPH